MWVPYLTRLGQQYHARGVAGLFVHDFKLQAGEIVDASSKVSAKRLQIYTMLAGNHPWAQYMWTDTVGTTIFPDERNVYDRTSQNKNIEPFIKALIHYKRPIGMGAILWKDKNHEPRYVFAIAVLRPGDPVKGDAFTREEKDLFACHIPSLVREIQTHDRVISLRAEMGNVTQRKVSLDG